MVVSQKADAFSFQCRFIILQFRFFQKQSIECNLEYFPWTFPWVGWSQCNKVSNHNDATNDDPHIATW